MKNDCVLPTNQMFLTQARLGSLGLNDGEILKLIRALKVNKAHGHDDISIRMIKICDTSLLKPLIISFENSTKSSCYPYIWKKSNIISVHKKSEKQLVKNYRPISLLPIFGKILEKICPSDSCKNQLLAITHEIFEAFDCNPLVILLKLGQSS